ncbi:MAG: RIO1 family regulatory kinase/ATPase [Planctomycetota bacterium]
MSPLPQLTREELDRLPRQALGKRSAFRPRVWRVETPGGPVVVKDAHENGLGTRWLARWLIARERRILERLIEFEGVPHLVGTIRRDAIVLSYVPGQPLDAERFRANPRAIFEQILELTQRLHELGVFHLDLHQRKNLLLDDAGRVHLVDFGAAVAPGRLALALFGGALRHADRQAAFKYMARFAPEGLSEDEARSVLRYRRIRWMWPFTPHSKRESRAARVRLSAGRRS